MFFSLLATAIRKADVILSIIWLHDVYWGQQQCARLYAQCGQRLCEQFIWHSHLIQ